MEDNKIRIGITQGDINGVGYEVILKTFAEPAMLELCTPIVYGSPKVAAYHRKSLDLPTNFSIVESAEDAAPDRLSIAGCSAGTSPMSWDFSLLGCLFLPCPTGQWLPTTFLFRVLLLAFVHLQLQLSQSFPRRVKSLLLPTAACAAGSFR